LECHIFSGLFICKFQRKKKKVANLVRPSNIMINYYYCYGFPFYCFFLCSFSNRFAICLLHLWYEGIVKTTLRYTAIAGGKALCEKLNQLAIALPSFPWFKAIGKGVFKLHTSKYFCFSFVLLFFILYFAIEGKGKEKVQLCPLTGGQLRWFVQCSVVLFLCIPKIDEKLLLIWRIITELDAELDKDYYTEEDLAHLRVSIKTVRPLSLLVLFCFVLFCFVLFCFIFSFLFSIFFL
jgi:hypothetical protein